MSDLRCAEREVARSQMKRLAETITKQSGALPSYRRHILSCLSHCESEDAMRRAISQLYRNRAEWFR